MQTLKDILHHGKQILKENGFENYTLEAELLLVKAIKIDRREQLLLKLNEPSDKSIISSFLNLIKRRLNCEPISQIIGVKYFWDYEFEVNQHVLTPRSDSETIIEQVIKYFKDKQKTLSIIDLGTGSGCLCITLAKIYPYSLLTAIDISHQSLNIAKRNASNNDVVSRINFIQSDWFSKVFYQEYDIVVCNPPYIALNEMDSLDVDVKGFEPHIALTDFSNGLRHYKKIARNISKFMHKNSIAFFEVGINQAMLVKDIFINNNLEVIDIVKDLNQIDRCVIIKKHT